MAHGGHLKAVAKEFNRLKATEPINSQHYPGTKYPIMNFKVFLIAAKFNWVLLLDALKANLTSLMTLITLSYF
jgi:hypothetical protein